MLQALLLMDDTDLCIQMNMQDIEFWLEESLTTSALPQRILASPSNLEFLTQNYVRGMNTDRNTASLEICVLVSAP